MQNRIENKVAKEFKKIAQEKTESAKKLAEKINTYYHNPFTDTINIHDELEKVKKLFIKSVKDIFLNHLAPEIRNQIDQTKELSIAINDVLQKRKQEIEEYNAKLKTAQELANRINILYNDPLNNLPTAPNYHKILPTFDEAQKAHFLQHLKFHLPPDTNDISNQIKLVLSKQYTEAEQEKIKQSINPSFLNNYFSKNHIEFASPDCKEHVIEEFKEAAFMYYKDDNKTTNPTSRMFLAQQKAAADILIKIYQRMDSYHFNDLEKEDFANHVRKDLLANQPLNDAIPTAIRYIRLKTDLIKLLEKQLERIQSSHSIFFSKKITDQKIRELTSRIGDIKGKSDLSEIEQAMRDLSKNQAIIQCRNWWNFASLFGSTIQHKLEKFVEKNSVRNRK